MRWFRLARRALWGDYGDILQQGLLEVDDNGSRLTFSGCYPFSPIMLPKKRFVCTDFVHSRIMNQFPELRFQRCFLGVVVSIDWRSWVETKHPQYPKSGEPSGYLSEWPLATPDEGLWVLVPTITCILKALDYSQILREFPQMAAPSVIPETFEENAVVMGGKFPTSKESTEIFCTERFASLLQELGKRNVWLQEYSTYTGEPVVSNANELGHEGG